MRKLLFAQACVLAITVALFFLGTREHFFLTIFWYDIPMHILGGLWAALAGGWLLSFLGSRANLWQCIAIAFVVGVAWEIFEYALGIGGSVFMSYPIDTAKDLFDDCIGGAIAAYVIRAL